MNIKNPAHNVIVPIRISFIITKFYKTLLQIELSYYTVYTEQKDLTHALHPILVLKAGEHAMRAQKGKQRVAKKDRMPKQVQK